MNHTKQVERKALSTIDFNSAKADMGHKNEKIPYRQIHLDFHTSPYIEGVADQFDKEEFVNTLKKAHVNSINLFTKCHHGMYYYPTQIGTVHPNLKIDLFGEQRNVCKENGIRVLAYTCVAWNEDWADRHPEWLVIDHEGVLGHKKPFDASHCAWRSLCINNRDYREVLKAELKEIYQRLPLIWNLLLLKMIIVSILHFHCLRPMQIMDIPFIVIF